MKHVSKYDLDSSLRHVVRRLQELKILTQRELAAAAGIGRSALTSWLAGQRSITLRTASKLLSVLGATAFGRQILDEDDESGRRLADDLSRIEQAKRHFSDIVADTFVDRKPVDVKELDMENYTHEK